VLEGIPAYRARIADARSSEFKSTCPAVFVTDLTTAPDQADQLFEAFDQPHN
jgi:hypothetical protein